jgi:glyoxylase-like metal-dependent hydrolase (beta-lactamase superfamily II)
MSQSGEIDPVPAPVLNAPVSANTCELWAIDATCDILVPTVSLIQPEIKGHEFLNLPTFAFYIHNPRLNKRVLFDNGGRKDWWNVPPDVANNLKNRGVAGIQITHDVHDILAAGGVDPETIDSVVWSHFHWDHVGNIQLFPKSTDVVVGPGFKKAFLPGYPVEPTSPLYEADFEGRNLHEIEYDDSLKIGQFQAHDFFGDGSFYILNTPGHTIGHVSGLVRTTPDTFVFLGGDISHFPGMYRPTRYAPLPEVVPPETKLDARLPVPCACSLFTAYHPNPSAARTTPFYHVSQHPDSWYGDALLAQKSVDGLAEFDASENVFVATAHDPALREICEQFPHATMNEWKAKGWTRQAHWHFLNELPVDGKPGRPKIVEGLLKDGKPID